MYVLTASIQIKPGTAEQFEAAIVDDATCSVRDEPGCLRFEVLRDERDPLLYRLVEVYRDPAAFQAHTRTEHYQRFFSVAPALFDGEPRLEFSRSVYPAEGSAWQARG